MQKQKDLIRIREQLEKKCSHYLRLAKLMEQKAFDYSHAMQRTYSLEDKILEKIAH